MVPDRLAIITGMRSVDGGFTVAGLQADVNSTE